jgi:molybdopterin biosynthesis enzyme
MKVTKIPSKEAVGHILLHNQTGSDGRKVLKKGQQLSTADIEILQDLGQKTVYVAILEENDVGENEAAHTLGQLLQTEQLSPSTATTGRVNLIAHTAGVFKTNVEALLGLNEVAGITVATVSNNVVVQPKKIVGTIKIIPYSVPRSALEAATQLIEEKKPLVEIKPFTIKQAVLITTGSEAARQKVIGSFTPALRERVATYNAELKEGPYVPEDEHAIRQAIEEALANQAELILIAGETSIMDVDDITPQAIKAAGGEIVHHGVPVEPGNLLLLAYHQQTPIVGAPGCARSKSYNVVDMVLPRLAAGERLTRQDLIALGHGGYLQ